MFSAPFDAEIVESCLGSLDSFKAITQDYLAKLEHPGARAALGAMLTSLRRFVDTWHGFTTRRIWDRPFSFDSPRFREERRTGAEFFQDLGSLRSDFRLLVELLVDIEPKISVLSIMGPPPSRR